MEKKSILLASLFSIIIPGSGKYYLKQPAEATAALFLNILALAPLIETIIKVGLISTATLLSGLVFAPVYLATIYGTYISKKSLLKKLNLQLKNEVLDYCTYQLRN
jgi:TM2 domain-containing membrane protein YozV